MNGEQEEKKEEKPKAMTINAVLFLSRCFMPASSLPDSPSSVTALARHSWRRNAGARLNRLKVEGEHKAE